MTPEFSALQSALMGLYVLERELGRGGMGVVFLARDVALDRPVAIKLLPEALAANPELRSRFLLEARTAARLSHPHLVPIHAVEERGALVCFVMAYVPGETLAERVARSGPLNVSAVERLLQEIAWALAYAHERGVVHRDIKPENILLERGTGRALLTDFGIARQMGTAGVTPPGDVVGTARSMSPEQAAGLAVDGRSDIYSLGICGFFALTGRFPFEAESNVALLRAHLSIPAPPIAALRPDLPPALARVIDTTLAKSPDDRFPSAAALGEFLAANAAGAPVVADSLARLVRETGSFMVDLAGYVTLALVALLTQALTAGSDLLGMGYVYTVGIALVLTSLSAIRGFSVVRMIRDAVREGWDVADFDRAARLQAPGHTPAGSKGSGARQLVLFAGGFAALIAFWLGPKQWALTSLEGPIAYLVEVLSLLLPVALGRWAGAALAAPRAARPGLLARLGLLKVRWLYRLFDRGVKQPATAPAAAPTEALLADASRVLYQALPVAQREVLGDVLGAITRLEQNAERLRVRVRQLDGAAAQVGIGGQNRLAAAGDFATEQRHAVAQLSNTVSALETLRLELLRAQAGLGPRPGLTGSLEELRRLSDGVDAMLEARKP